MQFLAQSDRKITLVSGLQSQLLWCNGRKSSSSCCYIAWLKKLAFRDETAAQQRMQWLIHEMSTLPIQTVTKVQNETVKPITNFNSSNKNDLWAAFDLQVEERQNTREVVDATIQGKHYLEGKHYVEENILQRKAHPLKEWKDHGLCTLLGVLAL